MTGVREIAAKCKIDHMAKKGGAAACRVSEISGFVQGLQMCGHMTEEIQRHVRQVTQEISDRHYREQHLAALKADAEEKARIHRENHAKRRTLCEVTGCTNPATHTWQGHPTCDDCGSPTRAKR